MTFVEVWAKKIKSMVQKDYCWKHFGASILLFLPRPPWMLFRPEILHAVRTIITKKFRFFYFTVHARAYELRIKTTLLHSIGTQRSILSRVINLLWYSPGLNIRVMIMRDRMHFALCSVWLLRLWSVARVLRSPCKGLVHSAG